MKVTIAELVEKLLKENQADEVEYIVSKVSGEIVVASISEATNKPMKKLLQMF